MPTVRIQTGATERIEALILDGSLVPLTGKADILVSVRRWSDGYFLDWADDTFKASGWTTRQVAMTEISAVNAPGEYYHALDTSAITNATADDTYEVRVDQSPGTDAKNVPQVGEIKVGQYVDDLDAAVSSRAVPGDEMALEDDAITSSKYDETTAFPLAAADSGSTQVARTGADGDTLETLSDQLDVAQADLDNPSQYQADVSALALEVTAQSILADTDAIDTRLPSDPADQSAVEAAITAAEANIRGADGDDLKDLSDQLDVAQADLDNPSQYQADVSLLALEANVEGHVTAALNLYDPPTAAELAAAVAPLALEANVQGYAAAALAAYDPPTKAELDAAVAPLALEANVQGHAAAALTAYDPPTDAEMLAAFALVPGAVDAELTANHGAGAWNTGDPATIAAAVWDTDKSLHVGAGTFGEEVQGHATPAEVKTQADQALVDYDPPTDTEMDAQFAAVPDAVDVKLTLTHGAGSWQSDSAPTADTIAATVWNRLASLHTSVGTMGELQNWIAVVKGKTDNLPVDPADQSAVEAAITAAVAGLAIEANVEGHAAAALATYDPPTKAELDSAELAILTAIGTRAAPGDAMDLVGNAVDAAALATSAVAEIQAGLSTFDPVTDTVDVGAVAGSAVAGVDDFKADVSGLSTFDPSTDEVDLGKVRGVAVVGVDDFKADVSGLSTFDPLTDAVDVGAVAGVAVAGVDDFKADVSGLALEANVQGYAAAALAAYDGPTKSEMDAGFAGIASAVTTAAIRDAVWDADQADYTDADTMGRILSKLVRGMAEGGMAQVGSQWIMYDPDAPATPLVTFNTFDQGGDPAAAFIYKREKV